MSEFALVPIGYRFTAVIASHVKYALTTLEMSTAERLHMLEQLNSLVDLQFTAEVLAAIQPACKAAVKIIHEAMNVDRGTGRCDKSADLLTSEEVFGHLRRLNPSLDEAMRIFLRRHQPPPAPSNPQAPVNSDAPHLAAQLPDHPSPYYPAWAPRADDRAERFARGTMGHPDGDIDPFTGR